MRSRPGRLTFPFRPPRPPRSMQERKMHRKLLYLLAVGLFLPLASAGAADRDPVISRCLVTLAEGGDLTLPAREPGPLVSMEGKEGMQFKKDTAIGRIDDSEATAQKKIKFSEYKGA